MSLKDRITTAELATTSKAAAWNPVLEVPWREFHSSDEWDAAVAAALAVAPPPPHSRAYLVTLAPAPSEAVWEAQAVESQRRIAAGIFD
jgi:hypothetical protein